MNYAKRIYAMEESANIVKKLFTSMTDPEVISFGGGAPAAEALPHALLADMAKDVLLNGGIRALQYGPIEGLPELRKAVVSHLLTPKGIDATVENVFITAGGLEGVSLICQLYLDPGDVILVESPTFVHCIEIFDMFQARCISVETDEDGLVPADLERKIQDHRPKMIYTIPTFQNPSGRTLSEHRRKEVARLATKYDVLVLEDDPYRDIRYSGEELAPIATHGTPDRVIMANSFSKIFSPGLRLGYIVASPTVVDKLKNVKSATNSHTSILPQLLCAAFFRQGHYPRHHQNLISLYKERRDAMLAAIDRYFPRDTKRTTPDGGLFTWVRVPGVNTTALLEESVREHKVAFVAGEGFFVERDGRGQDAMRLSFGANPPERIEEGIRRLGRLLQEKKAEKESD